MTAGTEAQIATHTTGTEAQIATHTTGMRAWGRGPPPAKRHKDSDQILIARALRAQTCTRCEVPAHAHTHALTTHTCAVNMHAL